MRSLLLLLPTFVAALRLPIVEFSNAGAFNSPSRGAFVRAAGLGLAAAALPAHASEMYTASTSCTDPRGMCSGSGKSALASYDQMLLARAKDELDEMSKEEPSKAAVYDECKRLVALILDLDWPALQLAVKKLDPEKDTTKRLVSGVQKQDPKITAKAILDLADDLDVAAFSSAGSGQPALRSF